jgi:hypothetical protein
MGVAAEWRYKNTQISLNTLIDSVEPPFQRPLFKNEQHLTFQAECNEAERANRLLDQTKLPIVLDALRGRLDSDPEEQEEMRRRFQNVIIISLDTGVANTTDEQGRHIMTGPDIDQVLVSPCQASFSGQTCADKTPHGYPILYPYVQMLNDTIGIQPTVAAINATLPGGATTLDRYLEAWRKARNIARDNAEDPETFLIVNCAGGLPFESPQLRAIVTEMDNIGNNLITASIGNEGPTRTMRAPAAFASSLSNIIPVGSFLEQGPADWNTDFTGQPVVLGPGMNNTRDTEGNPLVLYGTSPSTTPVAVTAALMRILDRDDSKITPEFIQNAITVSTQRGNLDALEAIREVQDLLPSRIYLPLLSSGN